MSSQPNAQQIAAELTDQIASMLGLDENKVTPQTNLDSLGIDSIRLMEILIFIEREYGIKMIDAGLDKDTLKNSASLAARAAEVLQKKETDENGQ